MEYHIEIQIGNSTSRCTLFDYSVYLYEIRMIVIQTQTETLLFEAQPVSSDFETDAAGAPPRGASNELYLESTHSTWTMPSCSSSQGALGCLAGDGEPRWQSRRQRRPKRRRERRPRPTQPNRSVLWSDRERLGRRWSSRVCRARATSERPKG